MDDARLARLERQVAYLYRHLGLDPNAADFSGDAGYPPEFYQALSENNMILAIKLYREATGVGLREAKQAVEAMARRGWGRH